MKIIEELSEKMHEELEDAEEYIDMAIQAKEEMPSLAETLHKIAGQELEHYMMLHKETVKIIEKYRTEHGEPPEKMMAVYDYLHKKAKEHMAEVKVKMEMIR